MVGAVIWTVKSGSRQWVGSDLSGDPVPPEAPCGPRGFGRPNKWERHGTKGVVLHYRWRIPKLTYSTLPFTVGTWIVYELFAIDGGREHRGRELVKIPRDFDCWVPSDTTVSVFPLL